MEAMPRDNDALVRVRAEFDQWRMGRSGRGRIPDRLWRSALALLEQHAPSTVCKELRLSASDLKKRRQALLATHDTTTTAPAFVELRAVDLTRKVSRRSRDAHARATSVRAVLERPDGSRLTLELPATAASEVEALCVAFLRG
jgi:hypothetical protein